MEVLFAQIGNESGEVRESLGIDGEWSILVLVVDVEVEHVGRNLVVAGRLRTPTARPQLSTCRANPDDSRVRDVGCMRVIGPSVASGALTGGRSQLRRARADAAGRCLRQAR